METRKGEGYAEQPAIRTTIVGWRPPGPGKDVGSVPRGIEVLVKKAAVMLVAFGITIVTFAEQVERTETWVKTEGNCTTIETSGEYKTGVINGRVTDENCEPVSGALVIANDADRLATTNGYGYFNMNSVYEGVYDVRASRVGYDAMTVTGAVVLAGEAITVNIVLKTEPPEKTGMEWVDEHPLIGFSDEEKMGLKYPAVKFKQRADYG
jgi:hypothetical protein